MKVLGKFMRNIRIVVVTLFVITILNPVVVTRANEYSLTIQSGKVVRVEGAVEPFLRVLLLQFVQKTPRYKMIFDLYPSDVIIKDRKVMTMDSFVIRDTSDLVKYLPSLNISKEKAEVGPRNAVCNSIKSVLNSISQVDVVSNRDGDLARIIADSIGSTMDSYGIHVYAVGTKKLDLPDSSEESVCQRMISERNNITAQYTMDGNYQSSLIRDETDKTVKETIAKADAETEKIKAEGGAKYMQTPSEAYNGKSKADLYDYVRSLDALKAFLKEGNKTVILNQNNELARILSGN